MNANRAVNKLERAPFIPRAILSGLAVREPV